MPNERPTPPPSDSVPPQAGAAGPKLGGNGAAGNGDERIDDVPIYRKKRVIIPFVLLIAVPLSLRFSAPCIPRKPEPNRVRSGRPGVMMVNTPARRFPSSAPDQGARMDSRSFSEADFTCT